MTKLLITEITRMGPAFCLIGLARDGQTIRSIRPVPANRKGWIHFPFCRGDILDYSLMPLPGAPPHVEDRLSTRGCCKLAAVSEAEIVNYLRRAECGQSIADLFGCRLHENRSGGGLCAEPQEAHRSICGCETTNLRLEMCGNELRATLALPSGEVLRDLPVVDRDWRSFADAALDESRGANRSARLARFLNSH